MSSAAPRSTSPVRVLWVIKGLGPGGAEALLVSSAKVMDRERVDLEVAYVRPDKTHLVERLESLGVPCQLIGGPPRGSTSWPARLRALMGSGRFDVVHVHSPLLAGAARLAAVTLPAARRPAVITTEHNVWGSHGRATRVLNGLTAPLDRHRWAVSDGVRESMWGPIGRGSEVLVQGIPLDTFLPSPTARKAIRDELGIPSDAVVACTVANLRSQKDYPNLLRACRVAIDQVPDLYVLAVGQGPLEAELRSLHSKLGLGDRVQLLGYRTDAADILAASDLFVMASEHEGYPIAVMEALASGLPVAATAVGGIPDAIHPGVEGVLVPAKDSDALASALVEIAGDAQLRHRMGEAARAASARYDIRVAVERQCEVYEQLAAARRGGSRPSAS